MIDIMKIIVSNQKTEVEIFDTIYSNNIKQYRAQFVFTDNSWDDFDKIVVFDRVKNYDTPIGIGINKENSDLVEIIDDKNFYCIIPWEIMTQAGYFNISIFGTGINDNKEVIKKSLQINERFTIQDSGDITVRPRIPTPNIYEQLLNRLNEINEKIENAEGEVGKKTEEGGEIFNDYENNKALAPFSSAKGYGNIAGGKGFRVLNRRLALIDDKYFVYEPYITVSDVSQIDKNYNGYYYDSNAKNFFNFHIISIYWQKNEINIDGYWWSNEEEDSIENDYIFFPEKPNINGDIVLGQGSSVEGGWVEVDGKIYYNTSFGPRSHIEGSGNISYAYDTHVQGSLNEGGGNQAFAGGYKTKSLAFQTFSTGYNTQALANQAFASGLDTTASGPQSSTRGSGTIASGSQSDASGSGSKATSDQSSAKGYKTEATGEQSDSSGHSTKATAGRAHAGGLYSNAKHLQSFVHGTRLETGADNQFVVGKFNEISKDALFVVGNGTGNSWSGADTVRKNAFVVNTNGTALVQLTDINKNNAVVNSGLLKSYVDTFYNNTITPNLVGKKIGTGVILNNNDNEVGSFSVATGYRTKAKSEHSLTMGHSTEANGARAYAGGLYSLANSGQSFVHGTRLIANAANQFVIGKFNKEDTGAAFIVGWGNGDTWNGTTRNGKNIFSVQTDGTTLIGNTNLDIDNAAVTSKLLKKYVSENSNSKWNSQSEMLFETGDLKIINQQYIPFENNSDFIPSESSIIIGRNGKDRYDYYSEITADGFSAYIPAGSMYTNVSAGLIQVTSEYEDSIPEIKIKHFDVYDKTLSLNADSISYSETRTSSEPYNGTSTWKELISAGNTIKYLGRDNEDQPLGDITIKNFPFNENWEDKSDSFIAVGQSTGWGGGHITKITHNRVSVTENVSGRETSLGSGYVYITCGDYNNNSSQPKLTLDDPKYYNEETGETEAINVQISTLGITHNDKSITWDRLFAAIEKIENIVDVSTDGQ